MALPHILLIIARGEAVRNFLYSETITVLRQRAHLTLLSVLNDADFLARFQPQVDEIIELKDYRENWLVLVLRELIGYAHYRWIWTEKVKNKWQILDYEAVTPLQKITHGLWKILVYLLANRPALDFLAWFENFLSLWLNPTRDFNELFDRIKPDLVFNASHIHAPRGELPVRVAHQMGIRTATFVFSWDNLSSRGRILPHYDHFLVWHNGMLHQLLRLYPFIPVENIHITGTPQFDYHFRPQFCLQRAELYARLGLDPARPFILYTTGMDRDFPEEVRHVRAVMGIINGIEELSRPQLVVRNYVKGTSPEMLALAAENHPGLVFPPVLWEEKWFTPQYEDLAIYTGLLRHCVMGINAASTVSLELMMHDKPVINLGFDPPGSHIPPGYHWSRHIDFDHYRSVASSGGVMVARSTRDLSEMIARGLEYPETGWEVRQHFITATFGDTLDGKSGQRAAEVLLSLAETEHLKKEAKQHA